MIEKTESKKIPVLVTTAHRRVFFGHILPADALIFAILVATSWVLHQRMSLPVGWGY